MQAFPTVRDPRRRGLGRVGGLALACLVPMTLPASFAHASGGPIAMSDAPKVVSEDRTIPSRSAGGPAIEEYGRAAMRSDDRPTAARTAGDLGERRTPAVLDASTNATAPPGVGPLPYDRDRTARTLREVDRGRTRDASSEAFEAATAGSSDPFSRGVQRAVRPDCKEAYRGLLLLAIPFLVKDTLTGKGCKW